MTEGNPTRRSVPRSKPDRRACRAFIWAGPLSGQSPLCYKSGQKCMAIIKPNDKSQVHFPFCFPEACYRSSIILFAISIQQLLRSAPHASISNFVQEYWLNYFAELAGIMMSGYQLRSGHPSAPLKTLPRHDFATTFLPSRAGRSGQTGSRFLQREPENNQGNHFE